MACAPVSAQSRWLHRCGPIRFWLELGVTDFHHPIRSLYACVYSTCIGLGYLARVSQLHHLLQGRRHAQPLRESPHCAGMHACTYACTCTCTCVCVRIHMHVHTHTCMHACRCTRTVSSRRSSPSTSSTASCGSSCSPSSRSPSACRQSPSPSPTPTLTPTPTLANTPNP